MFDNLREKWRKSKEAKAAKKAVYDAIDGGDTSLVKQALDACRDVDISAEEKGWFLKKAINNHNLAVFKEVLAFVDDPNTEISYDVRRGDNTVTYRCSPISFAISNACTHDISLWLANNPRVNIAGELMDAAKSGGMQDVALVLMKRIADLRRQEAAQLDKEAGSPAETGISGPLPATAEIAAPAKKGETWALMSETSVAHVTSSDAIARKLTEIFNFESRERVIITENLKSGAETIGQPESFDKLAPVTLKRAEEMLKSLSGDGGSKRSFSL